jgi:hypothetical protein
MKSALKIAFIVLLGTVVACDKKEKSLYDQVMDIHDEVMPKMDDIQKLRKQMKDSLANNPDFSIEKKTEIEGAISDLETARKSMMDWMHNFNPPEQTDKEAFQKYMETELVSVKKMREDVLGTLEKFKK